MSTVRKHITYSLIHDGHEFELTHEPVDGTENVKILKRGKIAEIRYLSADESWFDDYFKEFDQGEFYSADPRSIYYKELSAEDIETLRAENPGRVFLISKYEHSLVRYYRSGTAAYECPWDTSRGCAIFIVPEDAIDPEKYCDAVMEEFSDWCNGSIFGLCVDRFRKIDGEWERESDDACWGFIGYDYAMKELENFNG